MHDSNKQYSTKCTCTMLACAYAPQSARTSTYCHFPKQNYDYDSSAGRMTLLVTRTQYISQPGGFSRRCLGDLLAADGADLQQHSMLTIQRIDNQNPNG